MVFQISYTMKASEGGIHYEDDRPGGYGSLGWARRDSEGGFWRVEIDNDCIGFSFGLGDKEFHSLEAVEFIFLAFAHELRATGH